MFHFNTRFNLQEGSSTTDLAINHRIVLIDGGAETKKLLIVRFLACELIFYVSPDSVEIDLKREWVRLCKNL